MSKLFTFGIVCLLCIYGTKAALKTTFMEDLCLYQNKTYLNIEMEGTGILMAAPRNLVEDFVCTLTITSYSQRTIVLSIYRYDLEDTDELTIEDSDHHKVRLLGTGHFNDERKSILSKGTVVIKYKRSNSSGYRPRAGFQITYTKTHSVPCNVNEFQCKNEQCILKNYVCDGHNHCGDNSDQQKCLPHQPFPTTPISTHKVMTNTYWVLGISICAIVLFIVVAVFLGMLMMKRRTTKPPLPETPLPPPATAPPPSEGGSFYSRVRRSLRRHHQAEDVPKQETYQVPAMYPTIPPAMEIYGGENPAYKREE